MSGLFGGGQKQPALPPPTPSVAHEDVQAAGDAERRRQRAAAGRAATMLTRPGSQLEPAMVGTKKLLGN